MESGNTTTPRFFCDAMLGRLARWLRLLGYDAAYEGEIDDWQMLRICAQQQRLLLTRDAGVMQRWQIGRGLVQAVQVEHDKVQQQLAEVTSRLGLTTGAEPRCAECNLVLEILPRDEARALVPPYVFETQNDFRRCPGCRRVYWKATHWEKIESARQAADAGGKAEAAPED